MMGMHAIVSGNTAWRNSGFAADGTFGSSFFFFISKVFSVFAQHSPEGPHSHGTRALQVRGRTRARILIQQPG